MSHAVEPGGDVGPLPLRPGRRVVAFEPIGGEERDHLDLLATEPGDLVLNRRRRQRLLHRLKARHVILVARRHAARAVDDHEDARRLQIVLFLRGE